MKKYNNRKKSVIFNNGNTCIDNIFELEKIGSGHDGIVFRFNNLALKLLKYDITLRKHKPLMTYDKAIAFMNTHRQANRIKCATLGWTGIKQILDQK